MRRDSPPINPLTQWKRAYWLRCKLDAHMPELIAIEQDMRVVLDEAQNQPPEGAADGSITEMQWKQFKDVQKALQALSIAAIFRIPPKDSK